VIRYLRLLWMQLRTSLLLAMQYRIDFLLDVLIEAVWAATSLVPLAVVFSARTTVQGWTYPEALVVVGWFILLQGVIEGAINPSLNAVVEHVRQGTLDFVLLKPADAQFLVSTTRFQPSRAINALTAGILFGYAFHRLGHGPTLPGLGVALILFVLASMTLYSLWILTVSAAFYVVRIDNLTFLFSAVFDAARWPSTIFRGVLRVIFTFVIPLALMTTYPAEALLGRLGVTSFIQAALCAAVFALISRMVWVRAVGRYTSASS
jgi:ABC-2 type transport system permease protein